MRATLYLTLILLTLLTACSAITPAPLFLSFLPTPNPAPETETAPPPPTPSPTARCAVLCYHSLDTNSRYSISSREFAAHLDALQAGGHEIISMDQLAAFLRGQGTIPERSAVITLDDGWKTSMSAIRILRERNLPFTLFVYLENVGPGAGSGMLDATDLREIAAYPGATFANHSFSHSERLAARPFADPARQQAFLLADIARSKERFRELFGHDTPYFAFPYGEHSPEYIALLNAAGFEFLFTARHYPAVLGTDPNLIPRFMCHDLSAAQAAALTDTPIPAYAALSGRP